MNPKNIFIILFSALLGACFIFEQYLLFVAILGIYLLFFFNHLKNDLLIFALLLIIPIERKLPFIPLNLRDFNICRYFLIIFVMFIWFLRQETIFFPFKDRKNITFWIVTFLMLCGITTLNSQNIESSLKGLLPVITGFFSFILFYNYFQSMTNIKKVYLFFILLTGWICLITILQYIIIKFNVLDFLEPLILSPKERSILRESWRIGGDMPIRVTGTFTHPNILGYYLLYSFFAIFPFLLMKISKTRWRIVFAVIFGMTLFSTFATNSRGTILGTFLGVAIILFFYNRKTFFLLMMGSFAAFLVFAFTDFGSGILNNYFRLHTGISYRDTIWAYAWMFFTEKPLLGYGIDNYPYLYYTLAGPPLGNDINALIYDLMEIRDIGYIPDDVIYWANPHNAFLTSLIDMGIPGLAFMLTFFAFLIKKSISVVASFTRNSIKDFRYVIALTCLGTFTAVFFRCFFEFSGFYKIVFESVLMSMAVSLLIILDENVIQDAE
jgi:O-antigen ligase